ncbi:MAG: mechanosensitive ion channel domain-containing protein [Candidatus Woesearchaeota archaeon]
MSLIYYFFTLIGSLIFGLFVHTSLIIYEKKYSGDDTFHFDKMLIDNLLQPIITICIVIGAIIGTRFLSLNSFEIHWYFNVLSVILAVSLGVFFNSFGKDVINHYLLPKALKSDVNFDNIALVLLKRSWTFIVTSMMLVLLLFVFGISTYKVIFIYIVILIFLILFYWNKIENVLSYISIMSDNLFAVGDFISVLGHKGIVDKVGLEYTRIEKRTGSVVLIPNKLISQVVVERIN